MLVDSGSVDIKKLRHCLLRHPECFVLEYHVYINIAVWSRVNSDFPFGYFYYIILHSFSLNPLTVNPSQYRKQFRASHRLGGAKITSVGERHEFRLYAAEY